MTVTMKKSFFDKKISELRVRIRGLVHFRDKALDQRKTNDAQRIQEEIDKTEYDLRETVRQSDFAELR